MSGIVQSLGEMKVERWVGDPGSVARGLQYFRQSRVQALDVDSDGLRIKSKVKGSGGARYRVELQFEIGPGWNWRTMNARALSAKTASTWWRLC